MHRNTVCWPMVGQVWAGKCRAIPGLLKESDFLIDEVAADLFPRSVATPAKEAALLDVTDLAEDGKTVHGTLMVPIARYNSWLAEVSARIRARRSSSP
jgi:hypothetical protein